MQSTTSTGPTNIGGTGAHHRHPIHTTTTTDPLSAPHSEGTPLVPSPDNNNHINTGASPNVNASNNNNNNDGGGGFQMFLDRHLSMFTGDNDSDRPHYGHHYTHKWSQRHKIMAALFLLIVMALLIVGYSNGSLLSPFSGRRHGHGGLRHHSMILDVEDAHETWLTIQDEDSGHDYEIWFRTWGRMDGTGIPIVFIHGGPGNAIADYFGNSNKRFFADDAHSFFVVEIDQRGTGKSRPSVRDDWHNMKYYQDISIDKMCADFEAVRTYLGIDQWLVWGGSFGSTLAINYGERYPSSCLALIIRGIYLDTAEEVYTIYSRETYLHNKKRLHEFDILYQYAADYVEKKRSTSTTAITANNDDRVEDGTEAPDSSVLDPNDAERLLRIYAEMISNGDKYAIWHWFVFENNLMELDPANILDPNQIDKQFFRESQSVAFFETHLWLHGSFDHPTSNLMDDTKIRQLSMPLWVCQGQHDEVCPPQYARGFVNSIVEAGESPWIVSRFLNGTHEDTDPAIAMCLQQSLREFVEYSSNT